MTSDTSTPLVTVRADLLARLAQPVTYDLAVVGGGATGLELAGVVVHGGGSRRQGIHSVT